MAKVYPKRKNEIKEPINDRFLVRFSSIHLLLRLNLTQCKKSMNVLISKTSVELEGHDPSVCS